MSKLQSYTTGFVVGSLIGGLIVLLSTPKAGKEIREDVSTVGIRLKNTTNQLKKETIELKDSVLKLGSEGAETMKDVGQDLKTSISEFKEEINPSIQTLKADIEALKEKAEQAAIEVRKTE